MMSIVLFIIGAVAGIVGVGGMIQSVYNGLCVSYYFDRTKMVIFGVVAVIGIVLAVLTSGTALTALNDAFLGCMGL